MSALLLSRQFYVEGRWYAPVEFIMEFSSVVKAELVDTCNSAGDWSGYFVQKLGNKFSVITFSQSNNYPNSGFTLYTGDKRMVTNEIPSKRECEEFYLSCCY